ncbi:MAG TPA: succinate dehydrogenase, hydrophobic membrane anchor protein [Steroidobacteraceae bacterium]|jgi:succinate dehydrogenase / fumarate reductase membrane anchor subunit
MSLRAPLARILGHGAARDGVGHWLTERVTAIALAPLIVWLLVQLLSLPAPDFRTVTVWIGAGCNPLLLILTVLLACWHSWLGVQVVIEDYVGGFLSRSSALLVSALVHALVASAGVYAVLRVALRGAA